MPVHQDDGHAIQMFGGGAVERCVHARTVQRHDRSRGRTGGHDDRGDRRLLVAVRGEVGDADPVLLQILADQLRQWMFAQRRDQRRHPAGQVRVGDRGIGGRTARAQEQFVGLGFAVLGGVTVHGIGQIECGQSDEHRSVVVHQPTIRRYRGGNGEVRQAMELVKGANAPIGTDEVIVEVIAATQVDVAALLLTAAGKVRSDSDFIFYNQPVGPGVTAQPPNRIRIATRQVPAEIDKIVVTASLDGSGPPNWGRAGRLTITVADPNRRTTLATFTPTDLNTETAVVGVEIYRRQGMWKVRAVGQGYANGLAGIATDFGITVDDAPAPQPAYTPPPVNYPPPVPPATNYPPPVPPPAYYPPPQQNSYQQPYAPPRSSRTRRPRSRASVRPPSVWTRAEFPCPRTKPSRSPRPARPSSPG